MMQASQETWYRLWIVFVKLLKEKIARTRPKPHGGSPINALLPVVEMAFKMSAEDRSRAFQCWKVLIDIFAQERNAYNFQKRVGLLMIPLKSNNAKTEITAVAKLETWWHLIRSFQDRLENFFEVIVIPLLHVCFGKHDRHKLVEASDSLAQIPSNAVRRLCIEMFVEIAGHVNCETCVKVPQLSKRIISLKLLIDHWNDWTYSLSSAIKLASECNEDAMKQCISCMWKSFLLTVSELPNNNIRKDLFNDLLNIVGEILKVCI